MATCLDVVTNALKLARVISSGETPEADESGDGMLALQSLYDQWRIGGMFGSLTDAYLTADADAQEGYRYYLTAGVTLTDATNDYVPQYGDSYTECDYSSGIGATRQPRDLAFYESVTSTGTHAARLYDRKAWVDLLGLTLADDAPLASRNLMGLSACLATYGGFTAMFGDTATLNPDVRKLANSFLESIASKAGSTQDVSGADFY